MGQVIVHHDDGLITYPYMSIDQQYVVGGGICMGAWCVVWFNMWHSFHDDVLNLVLTKLSNFNIQQLKSCQDFAIP